jgi:hypothetical protein
VTPLDFVRWRRRVDLRATPATIARVTLRRKLFVARARLQESQRFAKVPMKYGFY